MRKPTYPSAAAMRMAEEIERQRATPAQVQHYTQPEPTIADLNAAIAKPERLWRKLEPWR